MVINRLLIPNQLVVTVGSTNMVIQFLAIAVIPNIFAVNRQTA